MLRKNYDLVVIGGGPVGVTAALRAAAQGFTSILIDATPPRQFQFTGPTGLYSKALRDSALRLDVPVLRSMGIVDKAIWTQVKGFTEQIMRKSGDNNMGALMLSRVPHLRGTGKVLSCDDLTDDEETGRCAVEVTFSGCKAGETPRSVLLRADNVLLATGSRAVRLPTFGGLYEQKLGGCTRCFDSDSIKHLAFLPRSVVVIGGGIIAVEFARIFAELAADVTMVIRASDLPSSLSRVGIDKSIGYVLQADLEAAGVKLVFNSEVIDASFTGADEPSPRRRSAGLDADQLELTVVDSGPSRAARPMLKTDILLTATGRKAVAQGLGIEDLGIEIAKNGDVVVDANLQTAVPGVYAAGDVIGAPQLASTGIAQAEAAVNAMFGTTATALVVGDGGTIPVGDAEEDESFSPKALLSNAARYPIGIWTVPELAFVGLTAEAASAPPHNLEVVEGIGRYSESIRGHVHSVGTDCEGEYLQPCAKVLSNGECIPLTGPSLKLVVERQAPHVVVGVHIFGEDACELVHFGTTLVQERKTIADVLALCYAAVTYHELYKLAARDVIATLQRDAWSALYHELDADDDGTLDTEEVVSKLTYLGATEEATEDIVKALFTGMGTVNKEVFIKRAQRLQSPLQLDLMQFGSR